MDELGFKVMEVKDCKYFCFIYFRILGGVLFEVVIIFFGFIVDESIGILG